MPYLAGIILALSVSGLATTIGLDRDRAFYPALLVVIASYYVLFAVMGGSGHALLVETLVMTGFLLVALIGFKKSLWLVVAALAAHGVFDFFHGLPGVAAEPARLAVTLASYSTITSTESAAATL